MDLLGPVVQQGFHYNACIISCIPPTVPDDAPTNIMTFALSPTSIHVAWAPPTFPNGVISNYTIYYSTAAANSSLTLEGGVMSHDLGGLRPHTNYTIRMSASTGVGEGPAGPVEGVVIATEQDGMCVCVYRVGV